MNSLPLLVALHALCVQMCHLLQVASHLSVWRLTGKCRHLCHLVARLAKVDAVLQTVIADTAIRFLSCLPLQTAVVTPFEHYGVPVLQMRWHKLPAGVSSCTSYSRLALVTLLLQQVPMHLTMQAVLTP
jgi:hypothetical protein